MVCLAGRLAAQCPDGTPRPCSNSRNAAAKRVETLDDRTWIVVPFKNVSKDAEIDWLRDGSVDLLSRDLSQWQDVRTVDDRRVADFLREMPTARGGQALSLNDGLGVARRAGAGRLVMGDLLRLGRRARVTATVYDVRAGKQLKSFERQTAMDSITSIFGILARDILNVPPPPGARLGAIGTSRVDAYQEYLAGSQLLNRFDAAAARTRFERALDLDSAFALAHYKLAIAIAYDEAAQAERMKTGIPSFMLTREDPGRAQHATAAARLSTGLPGRERTLINGLLAQVKGEYATACAAYDGLVAADSSDIDALYGLGQCLSTDDVVEPMPGDSTRFRFRANWNVALRVLRRALAVDPTFHLAFEPILRMLTTTARTGCRPPPQVSTCAFDMASMMTELAGASPAERQAMMQRILGRVRFSAPMRWEGDSLRLVPTATTTGPTSPVSDEERARARKQSLAQARAAADAWVEAGPAEARARRTLGGILMRMGLLASADSQFFAAAKFGDADPSLGAYRVEVALRQGRTSDVVRIIDSLASVFKTGEAGANVASMKPITGRVRSFDSVMTAMVSAMVEQSTRLTADAFRARGQSLPAPAATSDSVMRAAAAPMLNDTRLLLGIAPDSVVGVEVRAAPRPDSVCVGLCTFTSPFASTLYYGLRRKRSSWPAMPPTATNIHLGPAVALSRSDTAALRVAAIRLDSVARAAATYERADDGSGMIAADAFLILRDSAAAYRAVGTTLDLIRTTPMDGAGAYGAQGSVSMLWPRAMLLRADLAAALGERVEAQRRYKQFIDLWAKADPDLQPIVSRARAAYQAAGGR